MPSDIILGDEAVASLLIRRLDQAVKSALKARAVRHGRSMEAEARAIIEMELEQARSGGTASTEPSGRSAGDVLRKWRERTGGIEVAIERDRTPYVPRVGFENSEEAASK
jgi:plasmid stability protein